MARYPHLLCLLSFPVALTALACSSKNDIAGSKSSPLGETTSEASSGPETDGDDSTSGDGSASTGDTVGDMTGDTTTSGSTTDNPGVDPYAQARADCVERINAFRATENLPPLKRWVEQETCSDEQSAADADDGGHANFGQCSENAQNTCPGWGSVEQIIQGCLQNMWDEGPGEDFQKHGHYLNMSNPSYTMVACGFFEMGSGEIWSNQNFK